MQGKVVETTVTVSGVLLSVLGFLPLQVYIKALLDAARTSPLCKRQFHHL